MNLQNRTGNWASKAMQLALAVVAGVALSVMIVHSAGTVANAVHGTDGLLEDLANHRGNINKDTSLEQLQHENSERELHVKSDKKGSVKYNKKNSKKSSKKSKKEDSNKGDGNERRRRRRRRRRKKNDIINATAVPVNIIVDPKPPIRDISNITIGNRTIGRDKDVGTIILRALLEDAMYDDDEVFEVPKLAHDTPELSEEDQALMDGPNPCGQVDVHISGSLAERKVCADYLALPYIRPDCSDKEAIVPKIYYSVGRNASEGYQQLATSAMNPGFVRHHFGDLEAMDFVREKCGSDAAEAYACLVAPSFRADLFRFCALSSDGGVYLDGDIFPLVPLEELYSPCSIATVGHDYPQHGGAVPGKQMKILASAPGAPIFKCAVAQIIEHVRARFYPDFILELTGPSMLHRCYEQHSEGVAVTYHDTRNSAWPFTGMRAGQNILAYEIPIGAKHFGATEDGDDYAYLFTSGQVYRDSCALQPQFPSVTENVPASSN